MAEVDFKQKAEDFVRHEMPELKRDLGAPVGSGFIEHLPIEPHHWLQVLVQVTQDGNWMLNNRLELVHMKNFGNRHFKNIYLIIGHQNFYKKFCEIVGV